MSTEKIYLNGTISTDAATQRLDQALATLFPDYSRNQLQQWIRAGAVTVDGKVVTKTRHQAVAASVIIIETEQPVHATWTAQAIPLDICYEDDALIVVNKPAGLIVHPGAGIHEHTLVNALLYHDPKLSALPRAGLIHRLDKDTTGLLIVAKTLVSYHQLSEQMRQREIKRHYQAIVHGQIIAGGTINTPYGRHPTARTKMAVRAKSQRQAVTHYRVMNRYQHATHLEVTLETGRTHQIRVHLAHIRHPILGDQTYGRSARYPKLNSACRTALSALTRQALHAYALSLTHPTTQIVHHWQAPLPEDMQTLLDTLNDNDRLT